MEETYFNQLVQLNGELNRKLKEVQQMDKGNNMIDPESPLLN